MTYDRYFEFLRFSLIDGHPVPRDLASMDWQALYDFGLRQALLGVLFSGIKKLPAGIAPPDALLMQWVAMSGKIRQQSIRVSNVAVEAFRMFGEAGFRCCLLKGQGNALMYAEPYSRASGDVDMWLCGYADEKAPGGFVYPGIKEMRRRVLAYLRPRFKIGDMRNHHAGFFYKGVEIEAHFTGSSVSIPVYGKRFRKWCRENAEKQSENLVLLPDTDGGQVPVPTLDFNLIYQMDHISRHFFDMGIGMRQLTDYYHLLMRYDGDADGTAELQRRLRYLGLRKIAGAVMWVLGATLHLPKEKMIAPADEWRGRLLLSEILSGGNFGKFDTKYGDITRMSMGKKYFAKTYRILTFVRYYPLEAFCEPWCRTFYFFWRRIHGWK